MSPDRPAREPRPRALAIFVATDRTATVDVVGPHLGQRQQVRTGLTVAELLSRDNYELPADTPVVRADLALPAAFEDFLRRGPFEQPELPPGIVKEIGEPTRRYDNESWDTLGTLTYVATDVYLQLAQQAGIPVQTVAEARSSSQDHG
jgi:hypothetical protein